MIGKGSPIDNGTILSLICEIGLISIEAFSEVSIDLNKLLFQLLKQKTRQEPSFEINC